MNSEQLTITEAADSGNRRELLVAVRERVAGAVEDPKTAPRDLAPLTRRLIEVAEEIEAIDVREGVDVGPTPDEPFDYDLI